MNTTSQKDLLLSVTNILSQKKTLDCIYEESDLVWFFYFEGETKKIDVDFSEAGIFKFCAYEYFEANDGICDFWTVKEVELRSKEEVMDFLASYVWGWLS